jgi:hypothetical protein
MSKDNPRILRNAARCRKCQAIIESRGRWGYHSCPCGAIAVDGGRAYLRRTGHPEDCEEMSVLDETQEPTEEDYNKL